MSVWSADDRKMFLENMRMFFEVEQNWLQEILNVTGWNIERLSDSACAGFAEPEFVSCPIKSEHCMPQSSLEEHVALCEEKYRNYPDVTDLEELHSDVSVSSSPFTTCDTEGKEETKNIELNKNLETSKNLAELLKAERDAKRRRAAHRGKRVHSSKKTYNEVLREIIANEMQSLNTGQVDDGSNSIISVERDPKPDHCPYVGVGDSHYRGNPYKRWMKIEEEEKKVLKEFKNDLHHTHTRKRENKLEERGHEHRSGCDKYIRKRNVDHERSSSHRKHRISPLSVRSPNLKRVKREDYYDKPSSRSMDSSFHLRDNRPNEIPFKKSKDRGSIEDSGSLSISKSLYVKPDDLKPHFSKSREFSFSSSNCVEEKVKSKNNFPEKRQHEDMDGGNTSVQKHEKKSKKKRKHKHRKMKCNRHSSYSTSD